MKRTITLLLMAAITTSLAAQMVRNLRLIDVDPLVEMRLKQ